MGANGSIPESTTVMSRRITAIHSANRWKTQMESHKQSDQLMVIYFTGALCGPCRLMEPVLNELADTYTNVVFVKIDAGELMEVAREWGIQAIPTFLLMKKGNEVVRIVGAAKDELKRKIQEHSKTSFGNF